MCQLNYQTFCGLFFVLKRFRLADLARKNINSYKDNLQQIVRLFKNTYKCVMVTIIVPMISTRNKQQSISKKQHAA